MNVDDDFICSSSSNSNNRRSSKEIGEEAAGLSLSHFLSHYPFLRPLLCVPIVWCWHFRNDISVYDVCVCDAYLMHVAPHTNVNTQNIYDALAMDRFHYSIRFSCSFIRIFTFRLMENRRKTVCYCSEMAAKCLLRCSLVSCGQLAVAMTGRCMTGKAIKILDKKE